MPSQTRLRASSPTAPARAWAADFVRWYNFDHRHSGIRYVSPAQRHAATIRKYLAFLERCDTNGDGIGDLQGVIDKLDYVKSLGANTIWLNPCFESPFGDAGYDISDFYKVAPRYGTNADLKRLFEESYYTGLDGGILESFGRLFKSGRQDG